MPPLLLDPRPHPQQLTQIAAYFTVELGALVSDADHMWRQFYIFEHYHKNSQFFMQFLVIIKMQNILLILCQILSNQPHLRLPPILLNLCKLTLDYVLLGGEEDHLADLGLQLRDIRLF
jgi:hypothetical protein